jgi:hypothetical protein
MNARRFAECLLAGISIFLIFLAVSLLARDTGPEQEQGIVRLKSGGYVAFDIKIDSLAPLSMASTLDDSDSNVVHRVLIDEKSGWYLGYDLVVEQLPFPTTFNGSMSALMDFKQFKLTFQPINPAHIESLKSNPKYAGLKPHPDFKSEWFFKSARSQELRWLDSIAVDILVNPVTGAKVTDVISVNSFPASGWYSKRPYGTSRDFTLDDVDMTMSNGRLLINGVDSGGGGSVRGTLIYFYAAGHGRFIFSLMPRKGYNFQKVGLIQQNKIVFSMNGNYYEWLSNEPILRDGGFFNVWVLHDPAYDPQAHLQAMRGGGGGGVMGAAAATGGNRTITPSRYAAGTAMSMEYLFPKK